MRNKFFRNYSRSEVTSVLILKSFIQNIWIFIFNNLNRRLSIVSYLIVFVSNPCNFHRLSLIQQQSLGWIRALFKVSILLTRTLKLELVILCWIIILKVILLRLVIILLIIYICVLIQNFNLIPTLNVEAIILDAWMNIIIKWILEVIKKWKIIWY